MMRSIAWKEFPPAEGRSKLPHNHFRDGNLSWQIRRAQLTAGLQCLTPITNGLPGVFKRTGSRAIEQSGDLS